MATNQFEQQFANLSVNNITPQQYSADLGRKKIAPVVPPKPFKKPLNNNNAHTYENVNSKYTFLPFLIILGMC